MQDVIVNHTVLPDWYPCQSVVFVYPFKLKDREHLITFYDKLLSFIPNDIGISLVVKDDTFTKEFLNKCRDVGISNPIEIIKIPEISDIWIRDFAPITVGGEGIKTAWQFEYSPPYVDKKYIKFLQNDHLAVKKIWKQIHGVGINSAYFKWDMGNLTHNGKGIAIVTNRLIADNQTVNLEHELKPIINIFLGFKRLIFIPTEPDDVTGHIDGMVRFIDEKVLVVGSYPIGISNYNFMDMLAKNLKEDLGDEFTILRLENGIPEDIESEGIESAVGNHMNFLRLNDSILFPYYSDDISKKPMRDFVENLNQKKLSINVIPVSIPELKDLARLGGVLNCISWQVY